MTTLAAPTPLTVLTSPVLPHLFDSPADYRRRFGLGQGRRVHRFPAATYLDRRVAREERAIALESLETSDRAASRRVAGLGVTGVLLVAGIVGLLVTGRAASGTGLLALWGLGGATVVVSIVLVAVLRGHEREHDALVQRVQLYEARLRQLRPTR
ncbi:hypothetical protein [Terrabacter sp. MAHUQ-38]|jgi:hypothetical protein|uniref:hypothetical protein n=1 Tax=unclassified Terrabacter TaxID=2630222 RepID=UPI00165D4CD8|nr:hypothetical protein [Terrabacter sp. MAHUQ-38]MBC9820573.1 hypothetical protein [Terrabacter sp. MAHUQ-38]